MAGWGRRGGGLLGRRGFDATPIETTEFSPSNLDVAVLEAFFVAS
jgi:hypothetical protein